MIGLEDADLMRRTASGDRESFRLLVERYQKPIYNFFLRSTGSKEDSEDLTQDLFLNLFNSARRYREIASFKTYIFRIASNMAISFWRKRRGKEIFSLDGDEAEGSGFDRFSSGDEPVADLDYAELDRAFKEALSKLPPEMAVAMELRVRNEFSYKEIAEILGKSVSAVESLIFRARKLLLSELRGFRGERDDP